MRGSLTDLHIYDSYYDEASMIRRTRTCEVEAGEIFAWDKSRINILQVLYIFNFILHMSFFRNSKLFLRPYLKLLITSVKERK